MGASLVQLAGTAVGYAIGGPIGGAVGGAIGGLVGNELFPGPAIKGPRLDTFRTTGSAVGAPIVRAYGNNKLAGELMWFGRIRERKRSKKVGGIGGFGGQKVVSYEYYATFAIGLSEGEVKCLRSIRINGRIWWQDPGYANGNTNYLDQQARLLEFGPDALTDAELAEYNATALQVAASQGRSEHFTFYRGTAAQEPDPTIQSYLGASAPAYRDTAYVVFTELPVTEYGGALPLIEFEIASGDTQGGQTLNAWVSQGLRPWVEGESDPRHPENDHEYRYGDGTWRAILQEALDDASADIGRTVQPDLIGWSSEFSTAGRRNVSPYVAVDPAEQAVLYLHFNEHTHLVSEDRFFGPMTPGPTQTVCAAITTHGVSPGDDYFWWNGTLSDGSTLTSTGGDFGAGVMYYQLKMDPFCSVATPTGLAGVDAGNNCVGYPTSPDGCTPGWALVNDVLIECRRAPSCPPPLCDSAEPLPENPDYCVIDGIIYPNVSYAETTDGTFLQLAIYTESSGEVTQYPVGPVLNLDYTPHVAQNTEAWWEPFYLAAVNAGTVPAGWTFDATGEGGAGTYPRTVSSVCQLQLTSDPYCEAEPVAVADVIRSECTKRGLTLDDIDTSQVTDTLWGYLLPRNMSGREAIEQLRTYSWLDVAEVDGVLKFVPRGLAAAATLTLDDLGAHEYGSQRPPALEVNRVDPIQLPREVRVSYVDENNDYQPGQQYDRRLITEAVNVQQIDLAIGMSGSRGKTIATISLYDQWAARKALEISLGPRWLALTPADVVFVPDGDEYVRARIESDDLALPGLRRLTLVRDEQSLYSREESGPTPQIPDSESPIAQGPTTLIVLDLPALTTADEDAGYYVAMYGVFDSWESAELYRSLDGGTTFESVLDAGSAVAGTVEAPFDGGEMTVRVYGGDLLSTTPEAAAAGTNRFAAGVNGRWVIGTFETATSLGDGRYTLTDITYGLFDTEWAIETGSPESFGLPGDHFVLLETVSRVSEADSVVGDTIIFRAVTSGTSFDNAPSQTLIARGNARGFVSSFGANTPPAHSDGATHVVGTAPTDEWAGYGDYIAHDLDDGWVFEAPEDGRQVRTPSGARYEYAAGSPGTWIAISSEMQTAESIAQLQADLEAAEQAIEDLQNDGGSGDSALSLIAEVVTSGSQASVAFATIPATYRHLKLLVNGRGSAAVASSRIHVQFNGDTGSNYDWKFFVDGGAASGAAQTASVVGEITGGTAPASYPGGCATTIHNYGATVFFKSYQGTGLTRIVSNTFPDVAGGYWKSTAAITSILVFLNSGNFIDGSVVSLYGIK